MKIKTSKENLLSGAYPAYNAVSPKTTLPILINILIEAFGNKLQLKGTDLEIGVSSTIEVDVLEDGAITTPAKKFMEIVKELPEGEVTISTQKNNTLTIECEKVLFGIMGLPKDDFPKLPEFEEKETLAIPQRLLKGMLNMTSFATSHDETRYVLNGVLLTLKGNRLRLVATDGRRLALVQKNLEGPTPKDTEIIIPTKAINELSRTLKDEGLVKIAFSQNQVMFKVGETVVISKLIEGQFPNYEQLIAQRGPMGVRVARDGFLGAIRRASLLTSQTSQSVKLELFKDRVLASARSPDVGEAREEMGATYDGEEMSIGFNPNYLIDVLKNIDQDEVLLELTDPEKPGIIRGEAGDYIYVIMPMQLT